MAIGSQLLEVAGITRRFPGVLALDDVGMSVGRGEVVAVVGENGAGKSTLMKILAGVLQADSGTIRLDGREVVLGSVERALRLGISLIHQELDLADNLDAASNIFLGREPRFWGCFLDHEAIAREASGFLEKAGLFIDSSTLVGSLSIGMQQMVEIAKALSVDARLLIMDEPTSSLSVRESERLFDVIRDLSARGVSVVYISHRLGEVRELAQRVVVLRDGRKAGELEGDEITHDGMVRLMVGRHVSQFYSRKPHEAGRVVMEVEGLRTTAHPDHSATFTLREGEIVGIAGLVGAGRTELIQTLFGVSPALGGRVRLWSREVTMRNPLAAIRAGLALVPEDRKQQGIILEMTVAENLSLPSLRRDQKRGFLDRRSERTISRSMVDRLSIRVSSPQQIAGLLSGGNQQKVALGKWLALEPRVLLLDEPTRGIDVGAKAEIYALMDRMAAAGMCILFVSSEMEEILGMADRVLVMHEGRIAGELFSGRMDEERVMQLATGRTARAA